MAVSLMITIVQAVLHALGLAFAMTWEILWALALGFTLSAIVQAVVSKREMTRLLPDDSPRTLAVACGLGAASSSCSYAAVALARSIFRKGANFTAAMAFELASTNLVAELGIVMAILIGWQFTVAEFVGAPIMVVFMAVLFRLFLKRSLVDEARRQADRGLLGAMEGHAEMDMSVTEGTLLQRIFSDRGLTAISHYYAMDWAAIWKDIAGGLLLAGALGAWVPQEFWKTLFVSSNPVVAAVWGPIIGPLVSVVSFVCSIGNVPLAAILWNGGISFGGVIAFIFADLIIIPILNIYRKYYGRHMALLIGGIFYIAMVAAAWLVEAVFQVLHLVPPERNARVVEAAVQLNYTTVLDVLFLGLSAMLAWRFVRTGGPEMLQMMDRPAQQHDRLPATSGAK